MSVDWFTRWWWWYMIWYDMVLLMPRRGLLVYILYDDEISWGHGDDYVVL